MNIKQTEMNGADPHTASKHRLAVDPSLRLPEVKNEVKETNIHE